jgi:putative two-component system response regulator
MGVEQEPTVSDFVAHPSLPSPDNGHATILVVDDDPIARKLTRQLLGPLVDAVHAAASGEDALKVAAQLDPDLILLDVTMPGIDGFEVCRRLREDPRTQEVPVIMVTALHDRRSRLKGLEVGADDFICKPYDRTELRIRVRSILRINRYRRLVEERERRESTWRGALDVLSELLAVRDPGTFGAAKRIERRAVDLARRLNVTDLDTVRLASMFCQVGRLTIPDSLLAKSATHHHLSRAERKLIRAIPDSSRKVLGYLPNLKSVGHVVFWQDKNYDGTGYPTEDLDGRTVPLASRILRVARDFERLIDLGLNVEEAQVRLHAQDRWYDPAVIGALDAQMMEAAATYAVRARDIRLAELRIGMEVLEDIVTIDELLVVVGTGTEITGPLLERLHNFGRLKGIREPLVVKRAEPDENELLTAPELGVSSL